MSKVPDLQAERLAEVVADDQARNEARDQAPTFLRRAPACLFAVSGMSYFLLSEGVSNTFVFVRTAMMRVLGHLL